jgi:ribose transport system substrate-binding protein
MATKRVVVYGLVLCLMALLPGCGKCDKNEAVSENKVFKIAVIPKGTTHEFWKAVHSGARRAAKESGIEIIWKGPLKEDNREAQISLVEDFINAKVNGIVLAPLDDMALRLPVERAVKQKIPVVICDSDLKSDKYISFVATDNYMGGRLAAEHLAKLLGGKGKVIMLRYQEGSASTQNRERGFLDALTNYPQITLVSANQYGGPTTETAYKSSENLLAPLKGDAGLQIDGIFCPNESTTFGMLRALQDQGYAGKIRFVGFDSSAKLVAALKNGEIDGLVLQNPEKMGYLAVKTIVEHLQGKAVEKRIDTGVVVATKENMEAPAIKALLEPPVE